MNPIFHHWLQDNSKAEGVLGCAVRYADKSCFSLTYSRDFPQSNMELAWRCMADTFRVLKLHKKSVLRMRWVFEQADLHCAARNDGVCLGVFTTGEPAAPAAAETLARLFSEFQQLRA